MGGWRRWVVATAFLAALVCAPARADIPNAVTLSTPSSDEQSVALDDQGNASLTWRLTDGSGNTQIHFCRLPTGASACTPDTTAPLQHGGYEPAAILEDPSDGSQVRMVVETAATDDQFGGKTVVFPSGDGGATYGTPVASGGGDLILPSVTVGGPGAFSWSSLAFSDFLSGPLDGASATQPVTLAPDGPSDLEEPMGIGFPDPTTPLAVWYHVHYDNGATLKSIGYRHWLGTGSVNDPATWGPFQDFTPPDGMASSDATAVASGPKGVFALYVPQNAPVGKCGIRPELVRYDPAADTWSAPRAIDDDPHTNLSSSCGYDNGGSGTAFAIAQDGQGVLHALYTFNSGRPFADQSVPQGLLYSVSADGGLTWAKPVSIANTDQITSDGSFRIAVDAPGAAIITWLHSTGSSGAVVQARRLPAISAAKPGGTGPCPALITVGKAKLLATQGCWAKSGKHYTATGAIRVDGIDILPKGGSAARAAAAPSVSVDTATRILTTAGAYQTKIGSVDLGSKPVDWQLPATAGQLLDGKTGDPVQLAISGGQTVLGLPVSGIVTPSLGASGLASIPLNLQLPAPLDGVLGGGLTDDVTFTADVTRGLHLDRGSISIDLPEVDLGVARIHPFHVGYDDDPFIFEAALGLELPGGFGKLDGALKIQNGDLVDLSGAYKPPSPGIAVATEVFLTRVSFHLHKGTGCNPADQTAIGIGADLSGGGDIGGTSLLEIDGSAVFKLGSSSCHLPAVFRIDGDGKIVGLAVAHVYFQYTTPALLEFGASVKLGSLDTVGIAASVDGGINAANGSFFIEGKGEIGVFGYSPAKIDVIGSSLGLGACGHLDLIPGSSLIPGAPATIDAGGYVTWADLKVTILKSGCNVSFLKPKDFQAARGAAASPPQTFTVKRGTPSETFLAFGRSKAPSFVLKSPSGKTYTSPTAQQQQNSDGPAEGLTLDGNQEASILVHKPEAGTWTLTPQGDEPVVEVRTAAGVVMPRVSGRVRRAGERRFALAYKVAGASPDVAVDVFERGRGAQRAIGHLKGTHGVLQFTAAPGPGGRREIVAVPHGVDAPPTRSSVIAHYKAPAPVAPPAPRHVGLARGHGKERVSWSRSRGATRYVVRATLRDGRRQEIPVSASHRFAVLQHVPGPDAGTIRVYAIGPDRLISKPGVAKLKAVHVHRHKKAKKKRRRT